ncbi:MAG: hypothetical protein ACRECA_05595 [Pseudolabrys sp.]
MAIAPVSSASTGISPPIDSTRQTLTQLTNAIQSGNLSAAQSAYSTLSQAAGSDPNSPFAQALDQIGDALKSGDLTKAQQTLANLQQHMQTATGAHRHHGHHHASNADQPQPITTIPAGASNDPAPSTTSTNLLDVTA